MDIKPLKNSMLLFVIFFLTITIRTQEYGLTDDKPVPTNPVQYIMDLIPNQTPNEDGNPPIVEAWTEMILNPTVSQEELVGLIENTVAAIDHHIERGTVGLINPEAAKKKINEKPDVLLKWNSKWKHFYVDKFISENINFKVPFFCAKPKIITGITALEEIRGSPLNAEVYVTNSSSTGFTINFKAKKATRLHIFYASWMAIC